MTSFYLRGVTATIFSTSLLLLPALATAQTAQAVQEVGQQIAPSDSSVNEATDPFSDFSPFAEVELGGMAGGASLNLGDLAVNLSNQTAGVSDTSMSGHFTNGGISRNTIEQLSGINSLMFNTGNNVNFQSSIQVNVFVK